LALTLVGFTNTDSGLHLEDEKQKLFHLIEFHRLCGNEQYVRAYELWREYNWRYFGGSLNVPLIEIGITAYGGSLGHYDPSTTPGRILIHQSLGGRDTLQHELGHQWQHQIGKVLYPAVGQDGSHWCQSWLAFCLHTDEVDGYRRGERYLYRGVSSKTVEGKKRKVYYYVDIAGNRYTEDEITAEDYIDLSHFHTSVFSGSI
jgi:hypothetical protein